MPTRDDSSKTEAERQRAEHYARKQKWKELPGNRYTAAELRLMAEQFGPFTIVEPEPETMHLD
jgi:hypothetical protein